MRSGSIGVLPPYLILLTGLPGTGKTTLAVALKKSLKPNPAYLSTDTVRQRLFGETRQQYGKTFADLYSPENRNIVYSALFFMIDILLTHGVSVIVDGTFYQQQKRQEIYKRADLCKANLIIVEVTCSSRVVKERIEERTLDRKSVV